MNKENCSNPYRRSTYCKVKEFSSNWSRNIVTVIVFLILIGVVLALGIIFKKTFLWIILGFLSCSLLVVILWMIIKVLLGIGIRRALDNRFGRPNLSKELGDDIDNLSISF